MNFITQEQLYSTGDMKAEAKAQLKGHWKNAMILALIPVLFSIFFVSEMTSDVTEAPLGRNLMNVFLQVVHGFLLTSVSFTFLDFLRTNQPINPLEGSLQAFKKEYFVNLLLLKILKYLYVSLWTLLFVIPGLVKFIGYSQAELIFKDKVDQTGEIPNPRDCLKESEELMRGHKMDLFSLSLSFVGWILLSFLTLGLLYIWLTPYMEMSQVVFYENLMAHARVEDLNDEKVFYESKESEIGKDPDDFSDFDDF